jgi:hypothetical protein
MPQETVGRGKTTDFTDLKNCRAVIRARQAVNSVATQSGGPYPNRNPSVIGEICGLHPTGRLTGATNTKRGVHAKSELH